MRERRRSFRPIFFGLLVFLGSRNMGIGMALAYAGPHQSRISFTEFSCPSLNSKDFTTANLPVLYYNEKQSDKSSIAYRNTTCIYSGYSLTPQLSIMESDAGLAQYVMQKKNTTCEVSVCTFSYTHISHHPAITLEAAISIGNSTLPSDSYVVIGEQEQHLNPASSEPANDPSQQRIIEFYYNHPTNDTHFVDKNLIELIQQLLDNS